MEPRLERHVHKKGCKAVLFQSSTVFDIGHTRSWTANLYHYVNSYTGIYILVS